jgi:hypothetical protein
LRLCDFQPTVVDGGNVTKIVMRGLDDGDCDLKRYRSILRRFAAPAFTKAQVGV